jgi:hypothetical protein
MTYAVQLTIKSRNAKVGPIPVSTTAAKTCPTSCPMAAACYAKAGPLGMMWRALSAAIPGEAYALPKGKGQSLDWQGFTAAVAALPEGQFWRHNQAGDLPGLGNEIDADALDDLVTANIGKRGFTYTHKPMTADNAASVEHANANGFTINLSANNLREADELASLSIAPVAVVLPIDADHKADIRTPEGRKVVVCPATYRDEVSCASCQLCQRVDRKVIVGFPAHGAARRKASKVAEG